MKLKIKKGDEAQVITGSDKGRKGVVLEVNPQKMKVRVKGARIQTRCDKKEGLLKREGFIDYSNVKLIRSAPAESKKPKKSASKKRKNP